MKVMSLGKRLTGLVLVTLGAIGFIVCLAGIAGVWIVGSRIQQVNSEVFRQADELVVQVDRRAAQARDAVAGTRDLADELKQTLRASAKELVAERVAERAASLPEIENIERRLMSAMERADGLVQVSASTAELIEQVLATVGVIAAQRDVDLKGASELTATIRSTRESLANASERLADVQRTLAEIRQKRDVDVHLEQVAKLSLGIIAKLDVGQKQLAAFRSRLDETRSRLGQLEGRMRMWIFAAQWLILLLIGWGGAGQYCLLLQGWRILRPGSPTVKMPADANQESLT
jgi:chromosome segregation ATPase